MRTRVPKLGSIWRVRNGDDLYKVEEVSPCVRLRGTTEAFVTPRRLITFRHTVSGAVGAEYLDVFLAGWNYYGDAGAPPEPVKASKKRKASSGLPPSQEFNQGVAYAVAELIRRDDMVAAEEIWTASGATLAGVFVFDAKPIRAAIRSQWGRR